MNIAQLDARVAQLGFLKEAAERRNNDVLDVAIGENRTTTDDEAKTIADARAEIRSIDNEIKAHHTTLADLRAAEDAAEGQATVADLDEHRATAAGVVAAKNGHVQVRSEPLTYQRGNGSSYFADMILSEANRGRGDKASADTRLAAHAREMLVEAPKAEARVAVALGQIESETEYRDLNRTDGTGGYAVPPIWMMNEYITMLRAGRTTADLCTKMALPPGTDTINIPKVSTGTAVAIQTADNAAVQETDLADTSVQATVKTIAGQQDLAIQLIEQAGLQFDQIIFQDLIADYNQKLDVQVISGSNGSGQVLGIRTIASVATTTYTDASATVPELYPKIASAINTVSTTRFLPPECMVMHPRRWLWILSALDSTNRPLVVPAAQGPNNALGSQSGLGPESGPVGYILGTPVYLDPNIPITVGAGTEDVILVIRPSEYYLWEGSIRSRVLTEVLSGNLTVRLQVYNYVAFMPHRRPESTCIVTGSGLIAPTF